MPDGTAPKRRRRRKGLENWEIKIIKAMFRRAGQFTNDQDILAYFTRPTRSVNHRSVSEIRNGSKHRAINPASEEELDEFLRLYPDVDPLTGLHRRGDQLLIKAREAMISSLQTFNSMGLNFRAELFIVTAVIAWTYALHAWFRREGVEPRYPEERTKHQGERYWELGYCLRHQRRPVSPGAVENLEFILEIRHEIEHRSTEKVDAAIVAHLQACVLNFNAFIKKEFGDRFGLEDRIPLALQLSTFDGDQRRQLKSAQQLPKNIAAAIDSFESHLTDEQLRDPAYRLSYAFVPISVPNARSADEVVKFIKPDSPEADEISRILLKEVNKKRYTAKQVVEKVKEKGFVKFRVHEHTQLWKLRDAKNPGKGFGCAGDYSDTWVWFDRWIDEVVTFCESEGDRFK